MEKLKIVYKSVDDLIPYINNPRINDHAVDAVASSIKNFGFRVPVIIDKGNEIVAGHTRIKAAKMLGMEEVPTIIADDLTDEQVKAFRIADNKTAELAEWDYEILMAELDLLEDIDMEQFGFDDLADMLEPTAEEDGYELEVPDEPRAKLGEVYQLGRHRLMCGDSTTNDVDKLMNGDKADMVLTDPPYGMDLDADYSKMPSTKEEGNKVYSKVLGDSEDFTPELIQTIFNNFGYCDEIYLFGADYYSELIENRNNGSWVVWDKRVTENFDRMIGSAFEMCWSKAKHKRMIARINNTLFSGEADAKNKVHPTQKPLKLISWFFENINLSGRNIVVDLYGGSGSTLIACEQLDRTCYMMELDPRYIDVIIDRWEKLTGQTAELLS